MIDGGSPLPTDLQISFMTVKPQQSFWVWRIHQQSSRFHLSADLSIFERSLSWRSPDAQIGQTRPPQHHRETLSHQNERPRPRTREGNVATAAFVNRIRRQGVRFLKSEILATPLHTSIVFNKNARSCTKTGCMDIYCVRIFEVRSRSTKYCLKYSIASDSWEKKSRETVFDLLFHRSTACPSPCYHDLAFQLGLAPHVVSCITRVSHPLRKKCACRLSHSAGALWVSAVCSCRIRFNVRRSRSLLCTRCVLAHSLPWLPRLPSMLTG